MVDEHQGRLGGLVSVNEIIGTSRAKVAKTLMVGYLCLLSETSKVGLNVIVVLDEIPATICEDVVFPRSTRNTFGRGEKMDEHESKGFQVISSRRD